MDLMSGYKNRVQGVVGRVFGNEHSGSSEDSYVERLLDRISNGVLAEDRRTAMTELQSVVTESHAAQLAFGAMGFPVLLSVLKEERDDVEMVRGALETILGALTPIGHTKATNNQIQPNLMNTDLLSREADSISLLLSLLSEEDFYTRYYTLQLLTVLLTNSPNRLQEAILTIPQGITRLMDMVMDREVIRNEALLLLTYLTREAEEIQKIVVFEGAFEKIFSVIKEEGGSEGGVVVQDCLELLNNLIRNTSNQVLLRETIGFDPLISVLKLRGNSYKFTQQKTVNLLSGLETINLLIMGGSETDPGKDTNRLTNKTVLVQKKLLDFLLMLGVESQWAPVNLRCTALKCIGNLISCHNKNLEILATKVLGDEPQVELALNSILRIILRTSSMQEFIAADYVFKCFCEKNPDGQAMLASTLIPQPHAMVHAPFGEDVNMSFGSMLLHGLVSSENDGDLETCCRAASVLSYILKDNSHCKQKALHIELETAKQVLGAPEPLLHRIVKYLALAYSINGKDGKSNLSGDTYVQPIILKLLVVWLSSCPPAVQSFLDSHPHFSYLLDLVTNSNVTACVRGLTAVLLGECVLHNKCVDTGKDAFAIVDTISQRIGLTCFFMKFEEMQKSFLFSTANPSENRKPLTRSTSASMVEMEENDERETSNKKNEDHPMLVSMFDGQFVDFIRKLEGDIRESILDVYSHPKSKVTVVPADLDRQSGESDGDHNKRLILFVEKQCTEMQDLLSRNATLAEELAKKGGRPSSPPEHRASGGSERVVGEIQRQRIENLEKENAKLKSESAMYHNLAADLKSLSDAYNSLEISHFNLEKELEALKSVPAKAEGREDSDAELNDLLVCLGQEQSKVDKLTARLEELGEDVDKLLEGIGDDVGALEDDGEEED